MGTVGPFGMIRDELIDLVTQVMYPEEGTSEESQNVLMQQICDAVSDPQILEHMFWSPVPLSPEQVVDKALSYKPLAF